MWPVSRGNPGPAESFATSSVFTPTAPAITSKQSEGGWGLQGRDKQDPQDLGTTKDMLGQEPRVWLRQSRLASQGTRSGTALAAVVVEGAHRNSDASDESHGKPAPGNGAGRAGAVAAEQPQQQRSREWISHEGPPVGRVTRRAALPGSPAWLLFR